MSIGTHSALSQDTPPPHPVPVTHRHGLLTYRDDSRLLTRQLEDDCSHAQRCQNCACMDAGCHILRLGHDDSVITFFTSSEHSVTSMNSFNTRLVVLIKRSNNFDIHKLQCSTKVCTTSYVVSECNACCRIEMTLPIKAFECGKEILELGSCTYDNANPRSKPA